MEPTSPDTPDYDPRTPEELMDASAVFVAIFAAVQISEKKKKAVVQSNDSYFPPYLPVLLGEKWWKSPVTNGEDENPK